MQFVKVLKTGIFAIAFIAVLLSGCAAPTVGINARLPAKNQAAAELRKVAVVSFEGSGGSSFAAVLQSELDAARFDGQKYFTLLGSNRNVSSNASSAVEFGRSIGADGVYYGRIVNASSSDSNFERSVSECIEEDEKGRCTESRAVTIICSSRRLDLNVAPVLVRISDGAIIYSEQKSASSEAAWCPGQSPPSSDDLLTLARNDILSEILSDVAPQNTVLRATLKEAADGLTAELAGQFESAVALAKSGDVIQACSIWQQIDSAAPNHPWTTYNRGVCAEADGRFSDALQLYRAAEQFAPKTDSAVTASITRATNLLNAENALVAQQEERDRLAAAAQKEREEREAAEAAALAQRTADEQRRRQAAERAAQQDRAERRARYVTSYGEAMADAILAKQITVGMPPEAVVEARGEPTRKDVIGADQLWHYGDDQVAFTNGKVSYIGR